MPSKEIYLFFFLTTSAVLIAIQYFVYRQVSRFVRRDFPANAERRIRMIRWIFILMNIPLVFLFFRKQLDFDVTTLTQVLLYPYTIWQFLILMWAVILFPIAIIRLVRTRVHKVRANAK